MGWVLLIPKQIFEHVLVYFDRARQSEAGYMVIPLVEWKDLKREGYECVKMIPI